MNNIINNFMSVPAVYFRNHSSHQQDNCEILEVQSELGLNEFSPSYIGKIEPLDERDNYLKCVIDDVLIITTVDSATRQKYLNFWQTRKIEIQALANFIRGGIVAIISLGILGFSVTPISGLALGCAALSVCFMFLERRKMSQPLSYYFSGSKWEIFKEIRNRNQLITAQQQIHQWQSSIIDECVKVRKSKNDFLSVYKKFKSNSPKIFFHPLEIKQSFYIWCNQIEREYRNASLLSSESQLKNFMKFNPLKDELAEFAGVSLEAEQIANLKPIFRRVEHILEKKMVSNRLEEIASEVSSLRCVVYGLIACWLIT